MTSSQVAAYLWTLAVLWATVIASPCPQGCQCANGNFGYKATCKGGSLYTILNSLSSDVSELEITSASNSRVLQARDFQVVETVALKGFQLKYSAVQQIGEAAFQNLGSHLQKLDLSGNSIYSVSPKSFQGLSNLRSLNLSYNRINDIGALLQPLYHLQHLDLSFNALSDLHTGSFKSQTSLLSLRLDGNHLQNLHGYVFQGLQHLQSLSLRGCSLLHIASDMFSIMRSINVLDLGQNHISYLPASQEFRNLPALSKLYLDSNEITNLLDAQFSGITLDTLKLSRNRITEIRTGTFNFFNVRELDLSYNMISKVGDSFLRPTAPQLEILSMAGNPLGHIPQQAFEGLYRLESLNLSSCKLDKLQDEQLHDLQNLRYLDLSWNSLTYIPHKTLQSFDQLHSLSIENNIWHCNCYIKPFRSWLQQDKPAKILRCSSLAENENDICSQPRCMSPSEVFQVQISEVEDKYVEECLVDTTPKALPGNVQAAIVVPCLIVGFGLIIVTVCLWRRGKTRDGLREACAPGERESSHLDYVKKRVRPFEEYDIRSLTESDRGFVFRNYFRTMIPNPTSLSQGSPSYRSQRDVDSMYSSQPSLYSACSVTVGIESTV